MAPRCTLKVGGPARYFVAADQESVLLKALDWAERFGVPLHVLGGGSNVVVSDAGVSGLVIQVGLRGLSTRLEREAVELTVAAGEPWDALVAHTVERGWAGLECLSGIPGLVGATPIQNVGAYGQEVAETIQGVRAFDRSRGEIVWLSPQDCHFAYRDSRFKSTEPGRFVVLAVTYRLFPNGSPAVRYPELSRHLEQRGIQQPTVSDVRSSVLDVRRCKSMIIDGSDPNHRSCGSFFVNPLVAPEQARQITQRTGDSGMPRWPQPDGRIKLSAAWLIQRAGMTRGMRHGNIGLSSKHTLALVCHDSARADELVAFARHVRAEVLRQFGVRLVPEPVFWGFHGLDHGLPDERLA